MSFTYNDSGIRTSKTVNGVTTTYYLDGSRIVGEETNGNITVYFYDSLGLPIGFGYNASTYGLDVFEVYWYEKNLQGDIVAIYNHVGTKLLTYTYDAWGACYTTNVASSVPSIVTNNPFRYRGYYYDNDLSLYYLNSRYYDAGIGRFISADKVISDLGGDIRGYNLFAYGFNNPIMYSDHNGNWPSWATKLVAVAAVATAVVVATVITATTCGAGSIAGVAMITTTATLAAKTLEVAALQVKKGKSEEKNDSEIARDTIESIYDNGLQIVDLTPITKSVGVAFNHTVNVGVAKIFGETQPLIKTLRSTGGKAMSYVFVAMAWTNTIVSIFSNDPVERASDRGYVLK